MRDLKDGYLRNLEMKIAIVNVPAGRGGRVSTLCNRSAPRGTKVVPDFSWQECLARDDWL